MLIRMVNSAITHVFGSVNVSMNLKMKLIRWVFEIYVACDDNDGEPSALTDLVSNVCSRSLLDLL